MLLQLCLRNHLMLHLCSLPVECKAVELFPVHCVLPQGVLQNFPFHIPSELNASVYMHIEGEDLGKVCRYVTTFSYMWNSASIDVTIK